MGVFSAKLTSLYFNSDPKSSDKLTTNRRFHDVPAGGGKQKRHLDSSLPFLAEIPGKAVARLLFVAAVQPNWIL